jgi:hypothetical protein
MPSWAYAIRTPPPSDERRERDGIPNLPTTGERRDYTTVIAAYIGPLARFRYKDIRS